ncbi:patched domain-containing protein 3 [Lampris incognitus]|uniref:patched domain-containing protein 3 n=1 Tax=Lampris incognitus TaxID=2546036 RepID=UPI0024B577E0|nr:patched domain-containing protein 3 [Lampris incognitus]
MAKCRTDCIERPLRIFFETIGHFIGAHPWWFFIAPLILSAGLGSGFYILKDKLSNNIEEKFTPVDGQAKMERKYIQETFPRDESTFSSLRLSTDGTYATFIASNGSNILTAESLQEILDLDFRIRSMAVQFENKSFEYTDICALVNGTCSSNDILDIISYNASNINLVNLTFPWYYSDIGSVPLYVSLGSVKFNKDNSVIENAEAVRLRYYLREDNKTKTDLWLEAFMNLISNESMSNSKVSYATSMSLQREFERCPASIVQLFSITYAIAVTFALTSCWRLDNVRNKVWVGFAGVLSTGLALLTSFGLLLFLDQPFVMTVASCPFMVLGIGIDDTFIMISCWQRTRVHDSVPDRLANTYREAAVSISITTLTDALALFLGYNSPFGSVQAFCLYAGISVGFCYLYTISFLGAFMALSGQWEAENRHWFTCVKIPEDPPPGKSKAFSVCCVGGSFDRVTDKTEIQLASQFLEKFYGPLLTQKWIKACVFVMYVGYLAVSIYGCSTMKEGLDIGNLVLDDSYIISYYNDQKQHFSEYSYNVMVAVKHPIPYWSEEGQKSLNSCIANFENLNYVNSTSAWFLSFQLYANANSLNLNSKQAFQSHLVHFLAFNPIFQQDINLSANNEIPSSRFFIQTLNKTTMKDMLLGLRKTAKQCPIKLLVYHPAFIYFDQYTTIMDTTIQTILVAATLIFIISLFLIPDPFCSIWVTFAMCSVVAGVAGFMALWDVSLDSISMINLVICIGFAVDFSTHITYSYISSSKSDINERAIDALAQLGYPILQGAVSTILGVVVLSLSGSYIFRTFFKIMFLVIIVGLFHGLVFIPVFLTLCGGIWEVGLKKCKQIP